MKIKSIVVGSLKCNCYLIEKDNHYLLVDPGAEYQKIIAWLGKIKLNGILITHHHFDHIGCVKNFVEDYKYQVFSNNNIKNKTLLIPPFKIEIIRTKGHTDDSLTYYFKEDKIMFTGDFLFKESIGRCDLEGGNWPNMQKSIATIKTYPNDITIYPGHGPSTNLGYEKINNPYF